MIEKLSDISKLRERLTEIQTGKNIRDIQPQVSVVIPAYNVSEWIGKTLDSIFAQTFTDYEIIIVNDGSADTTELEQNLAAYFDNIVYAKQKNHGASEARNSAIGLARGEYIAFLDGDDIWLPDFLESQINYLEKNNLDMVYCDAELFGDINNENFMLNAPSNGKFTTVSLLNTECNVITSGTMLKKSILKKFGLFSTDAKRIEDFDLWFRLCKNGAKIGYQKKALIKYRVRNSGLSGSNIQRCRRTIAAFELVHKKYALNTEELEVWNKQIKLFQAELELETGKFQLIQKNFAEAKKHFVKANKYYQKSKLTLLIFLLSISPAAAMYLFRKIRSEELAFITSKISK